MQFSWIRTHFPQENECQSNLPALLNANLNLSDFAWIAKILSNRFTSKYALSVLTVVTFARAVYALNWYTISPGLTQIAAGFHANLQSLGALESAFVVGAGLFQVPAAYASAKYNAKLLAILGLSVMCISNLLAAFSPSLAVLIVVRFILGLGAAMFFSPAIVLVAPLFRNESQGVVLGTYYSAFNIGGVIALFGWVYITQSFGWRFGLSIGALLLIPSIILLALVIRHNEKDFDSDNQSKILLSSVLRNKQIWYIGVGIVGLWSSSYAISQFLPYFEINVNSFDPVISGFLTSLMLLVPIPGSIMGGWLSDRLRNRKAFLIYPTILFGLGTAIIGYVGLEQSFLLLSLLGLFQSFAFASMYAAPFQLGRIGIRQKTISISLMNSIQILGSFALPILFVSTAAHWGYTSAWVISGIYTLAFIPFLLFFKEPFENQENQ